MAVPSLKPSIPAGVLRRNIVMTSRLPCSLGNVEAVFGYFIGCCKQ